MTTPQPASLPKRLWLLASLAPIAITAPLHGHAQEQVIWEPVTEEQSDTLQILVPSIDGGADSVRTNPTETQAVPHPIVWEVAPETETTNRSTTNSSRSTKVVWESLPNNPSGAWDESNDGSNTAIVWEVLTDTVPQLAPEGTETIAEVDNVELPSESSGTNQRPPSEVIAQEEAMPPRAVPGPPPPPPLQALDRSIAFGDGLVGPDISWNIPNGFRWSQRWFADAAVLGFSRRAGDEPFWAWNNGDAVAIVHANVLQTTNWSLGSTLPSEASIKVMMPLAVQPALVKASPAAFD